MGEWLRGRARRLLAAAVLAAAMALGAGCGSSGSHATTRARMNAGHAQTTPARKVDPALQRGRRLFRANCAACHTLADAGTHGTRAGSESNFDQIRPNRASVRNFLEHRFGAMPLFRGRLSETQIDTIAHYVAAVDGCGTKSPTECRGNP